MRWMMVALVLGMGGCGPRYVESSEDVDSYLARGDFASACLGLKSRRDQVRGYTAEKLVKYKNEAEATACLCKYVYNAEDGSWDAPVAAAMAGTHRDDLAACLAPAASDTRVKDIGVLADSLGAILAPSAFAALAEIAGNTEQSEELRAASARALQPSPDHTKFLVGLLKSDPSVLVRAAAADGLDDHKDKATIAAITAAVSKDEDAMVRVKAVERLAELKRDYKMRDAICAAMVDDPDPAVRIAAVTTFKGTLDRKEAECLIKRLKKKEEDGSVRVAMLEAIKTSPHKDISKALCDQIGPYTRMYVTDDWFDRIPGSDIADAQNHNHWEASYDCVNKALAQGGYSCYARNYLAISFEQLGGKAKAPRCAGMDRR